jgi:hypothetical protein
MRCVMLLTLTFVSVFAGSSATFAQRGDAAYCAALVDLATRYLVGDTARGRNVPDLDTELAINDCQKGNTAAGIAVLERKLRAAGFTLPSRS